MKIELEMDRSTRLFPIDWAPGTYNGAEVLKFLRLEYRVQKKGIWRKKSSRFRTHSEIELGLSHGHGERATKRCDAIFEFVWNLKCGTVEVLDWERLETIRWTLFINLF